MRSLCTKDYWLARAHLTSALGVIERIERTDQGGDEMVAEYRSHTVCQSDPPGFDLLLFRHIIASRFHSASFRLVIRSTTRQSTWIKH